MHAPRDAKIRDINPRDYVTWNREREANKPQRKNVSKVSSLHREMGHGLTEKINRSSPQTYLQLIGHILLKGMAHQLPLITSLPENVPGYVLKELYIDPFIHSLRKVRVPQ